MARILVADDEPGLREFVGDALRLEGHDVVEAEDGRVAARRLDERGFDLLITDLKMPHLDGLALVRKLKAEQPEVEVIVMTAYGTVDTAVEAMKLGALDYLQKPLGGPTSCAWWSSARSSGAAARRGRAAVDDGLPPLTYGDPAMAPVVAAIDKVARTSATCCCWARPAPARRSRPARSTPRASAGPPVRGGQRRRAGREPPRERAVRPREGRVHRRGRAAPRQDRAGRRRHLLPRRGRRAQAGAAGQAPARPAGAPLRAPRRHPHLDVDVRWIAATNRDLGR
jgi:CheY-like chemotaxis protein